MNWYALSWEELTTLFKIADTNENADDMISVLSVIYYQCNDAEKKRLEEVYPNLIKRLDQTHAGYFIRENMTVRLINFLTGKELEEIHQLQAELKGALTIEDVTYYEKEIHAILDKAEARKSELISKG